MQSPAAPVTVKLPVAGVALFQTIPFAAPLLEMEWNVKFPSEFTRFTAIEAAVDMLTPLTVRPVAPLAERVPVMVGGVPAAIVSAPKVNVAP